MSRQSARVVSRALAVLAAAALAAPAARAQPATLTFDGLTDPDDAGVVYVANCYEEAGYRIALAGVACGTADQLASYSAANPLGYTGSPALFGAVPGAIDVTAVGGGPFSLQSMSLTSFIGGALDAKDVVFTGFLAGGGSVSQTVNLMNMGMPSPMLVSFAGFVNMTSFRLEVTSPGFEPYVQFDNVALVGAAVIPEPGTVALLGAGLVGLAAAARRRRR